MDEFAYRDGQLWCEGVRVTDVVAAHGTPLYLYSRRTFEQHFDRLREAFAALSPTICFSVKSCQNVHICRLLAARGSGFDVVSGGELHRALQTGADPAKIVFAGVGKTEAEMLEAFEAGIGLFNIESESELEQLAALAEARGVTANAALRVNPDVAVETHWYTTTGRKGTKFGVDMEDAPGVFRRFGRSTSVRLSGLHIHIGSPVRAVEAYVAAVEKVLALMDCLRADGYAIDVLDLGGGFAADYVEGEAPPAADYADALVPLLRNRGLRVILEPGRSIAANAGILLTRVLHVKQSGEKRFVIVDASMNELLRPALYGAYHFVWPVDVSKQVPQGRGTEQPLDGLQTYDVVGPVCESSDFLARDHPLPELRQGDLLAVYSAGAYAMTMASQYNSRPRAAEVLVAGSQTRLIRRRETYADLLAAEIEEGTKGRRDEGTK
jgi:diaminopimelate decarboxylase